MINDILRNSCLELQRRIGVARKRLRSRPKIEEVEPCYQWVSEKLDTIESQINRIKDLLKKRIEKTTIQQTLYSELSTLHNQLSFLDQYFLDALCRLKQEDKLALKLISWLHSSHPQTRHMPFVVSNGTFSVATSPTTPTLYYLPVTSEASYLHLPLFIHEFGHKLFQHDKKELEDLIGELQQFLAELLKPMISQDDDKYRKYEEKATDIVETWREWMEEFFCDAIGLIIGGPSYLYAFSQFTQLGGMKEFFVPGPLLSKRSHPVSLLRIKFLVERASQLGWRNEAKHLSEQWNHLASMLGAKEDYFGYFEAEFKEKVTSVLNDMIEEVNPLSYTEALISEGSFLPAINEAWYEYHRDPSSFGSWESRRVDEPENQKDN